MFIQSMKVAELAHHKKVVVRTSMFTLCILPHDPSR